jgi:hypothetical protein
MSALHEAGICLARALGLRQRELSTAGPQLTRWKEQLLAGRPVVVMVNTKSGRPRQVDLSLQSRAAALEALIALLEMSGGQAGHAVVSKAQKPLLPLKVIHGLRREFASQQLAHYLAQDLPREAALSRVAEEMGFGPGRVKWLEDKFLSVLRAST